MNIRKFYFTITSILLVFLFISGILILSFLNTTIASSNPNTNGEKNFWDSFIPQKDPVNILVLGGDKVNGNTDTIMLVNFNPSTGKASIISVPRDTKVRIEGSNQKINFAYPHGGPELAVKTVSNLLNVNISYYVYIDTVVFRNIIDMLGGVKDFEVPVDMNYDDDYQNLHIHLKKGVQDMDGEKAEQFMRFRHPNGRYSKAMKEFYDGSDLKRIEAQQKFIKELVRQKSNPIYLSKIDDILDEVFKNIETNMTLSDALKLAQNVGSFGSDNVNFLGTIPGTTSDGSPWYYLCEREKTEELMLQYFKAEGSFINSDNSTKEDNDDKETTKNPTQKKTSTKKSTTQNNPSNSKSNVKETTKPAP